MKYGHFLPFDGDGSLNTIKPCTFSDRYTEWHLFMVTMVTWPHAVLIIQGYFSQSSLYPLSDRDDVCYERLDSPSLLCHGLRVTLKWPHSRAVGHTSVSDFESILSDTQERLEESQLKSRSKSSIELKMQRMT